MYRRDQLVGSSVCGARSTWKTLSRPSWPTTSRTPTILGVLGGYSNGEVALGDLQDEILLLLAFDGPGFDRLDQCSPVVWIDNGVSDLENHQVRAPFTTQCYHGARHAWINYAGQGHRGED